MASRLATYFRLAVWDRKMNERPGIDTGTQRDLSLLQKCYPHIYQRNEEKKEK